MLCGGESQHSDDRCVVQCGEGKKIFNEHAHRKRGINFGIRRTRSRCYSTALRYCSFSALVSERSFGLVAASARAIERCLLAVELGRTSNCPDSLLGSV